MSRPARSLSIVSTSFPGPANHEGDWQDVEEDDDTDEPPSYSPPFVAASADDEPTFCVVNNPTRLNENPLWEANGEPPSDPSAFDGLLLAGLPPAPPRSTPRADLDSTTREEAPDAGPSSARHLHRNGFDSPASGGKWGEVASEADDGVDALRGGASGIFDEETDEETEIGDESVAVEQISSLLPAYSMRYAVETAVPVVGSTQPKTHKRSGMKMKRMPVNLGEASLPGACTPVSPSALNDAMRRHPAESNVQAVQLHSAGRYAVAVKALASALTPAPPGMGPLTLDDDSRGGWFDSINLRRLQEQVDVLIEDDVARGVGEGIGGGDNSSDRGAGASSDGETTAVVRSVQAFNAHLSMGATLLMAGFDLAATYRFRLAAAAGPPGNPSFRRLAAAQEAELRGQTDEAEAEYRGAEESARQELEQWLPPDVDMTSQCALASGMAQAGVTGSATAAAAASSLSRALVGQARCCERRHRPARTVELLSAAVLASPSDARTLAALARALVLTGDVAGSEGVLRFCCAPYVGSGDGDEDYNDDDDDAEQRYNVVSPAVHSAHAAALHDLHRTADAIVALRRGVANAIDPFLANASRDERSAVSVSVTGDGVTGGGGYQPDIDDPAYLEPAATLCVELGESLLRDGSLETAREANATFTKARWLAERMRQTNKVAKRGAEKIPNIVRREFAIAATKKIKVRATDLLWRAHLGRGRAMVALGGNTIVVMSELRLARKMASRISKLESFKQVVAKGFGEKKKGNSCGSGSRKTKSSVPSAQAATRFLAASSPEPVPSSRGAVAGALEAAHCKMRLRVTMLTLEDVVAAASAAAEVPKTTPATPKGRHATSAALVKHAVTLAQLEQADFSSWPLAPTSALEDVLVRLYTDAMGGASNHTGNTDASIAATDALTVLVPLCISGSSSFRNVMGSTVRSLDGNSLRIVDLRLALAVLACLTASVPEEGLTAAHTILALRKHKPEVEPNENLRDGNHEHEEMADDSEHAQTIKEVVGDAALPPSMIWLHDAKKLMKALRRLARRPFGAGQEGPHPERVRLASTAAWLDAPDLLTVARQPEQGAVFLWALHRLSADSPGSVLSVRARRRMLCAVTGERVAIGMGFRCVAPGLKNDCGARVILLSAAAYAAGLVPEEIEEESHGQLVFEEWV